MTPEQPRVPSYAAAKFAEHDIEAFDDSNAQAVRIVAVAEDVLKRENRSRTRKISSAVGHYMLREITECVAVLVCRPPDDVQHDYQRFSPRNYASKIQDR